MTQRERDRLVVLKKAQKKLITQQQAAEELKVSERQVRRLLRKLKKSGDRAVIHGLRGRRSNRRLAEQVREKAVRILSQELYRDVPNWLPTCLPKERVIKWIKKFDRAGRLFATISL